MAPGCLALVLAVALAASCSGAPSPQAPPAPHSSFPAAIHPPASDRTLAEQAAALGLEPYPRTVRRQVADDAVGGAQAYPFGLANPRAPERSRKRTSATATPSPAVPKTTAAADVTDDSRLPDDVVPVRYTVTMHPQIDKGIYYGSTDIYLNVNKATKEIKLHASNDLKFPSVEIHRYNPDFGEYSGYGEATLGTATDEGLRTIALSMELEPGKHYLLRFPNFVGHLRDDLKGFYLSSYKDASGKTVRLATTQFEPPAARFAFPCFDEPSFKARFKIIIEHDQTLVARSNMPAIRQTMPDLATLRTEFDETLPMSTYLLAWVVSDYTSVMNEKGDFSTWGRSNLLSDSSAYLSQLVGPAALDKLRDFTGIPYSLPKVDQFAIPDFDEGAMENWGLVTYREEYLLETSRTTIRIREFIATTVCHELGHQWTGDLVTLDWWSNTWLNEAFATYFENVICDQIIPDWKLMDKYVTDNVHVGIENDVLLHQHAMSSPASTLQDIEDKFDRITYKKGGAVLRMFEHVLGTSVWKKALHRYLSVNSFKNGSPARLFKAMDAEAKAAKSPLPPGVSFATMAKTWTEQAGVPVVTATRLYNKGAVSFTQQQFHYDKPDEADYAGNTWFIPIPEPINPKSNKTDNKWVWSLQPAAATKRWLTPDSPSMVRDVDAAASEWLLINPNQIGYYIVNYDETNWKMLQAALKSNPTTFDASTRTQLVHDALALARAGHLDYTIALPFLQALETEREAAPWRAGIEALTFLTSRLTTTPAGYALQALIRTITQTAYGDLGFLAEPIDPASDDSSFARDEERYLRFYIASYACNAGNQACTSDAAKGLAKHIEGNGPQLQADVRETGMCYGVRSSADLFEKVLQKWKDWSPKEEEPQSVYAAALSCTQDHRRLRSILDDILAGTLDKSPADFQELVNQILSRWDNHKFVLNYLKENSEKIVSFTGNKFWLNLLVALIDDICTTEEYNDLADFAKQILASQKASDKEQADVNNRLAAAKKNLAWYEQHYETVSQWLFTTTGQGPVAPTELPPSTQRPNPPSSTPTPTPTKPAPSSSGTQDANLLTLLAAAVFPIVLYGKQH